jgi:chorismate mutase / prephenate dehydratase
MSDELKALRTRIDELDLEILRLANERAALAQSIGGLKGDGVIYRPEREAQVLRRLADANTGPLPSSAVMHLFTEIISACRAVETAVAVACLGPKGTFSEEAVNKHFGASVQISHCPSIDEVFRSVESGAARYGVVPVENSTEGAVGRTLDLLLGTPLRISGEIELAVHQCFLSKAPALTNVTRVFSHAQSLAQCNRWLTQRLPDVERVPVVSNAEAARLAAQDPSTAAIAGRSAGRHYDLPLLFENIEDEPNNTTRFVVIGDQDVSASGRDKTSIVMTARNRPGAIHDLLSPLARNQVSMTRLESRPSRTGLWEYVFFVDVEGHVSDMAVARALEEMRERAGFLKVLGAYPVAVDRA